jgi:putative nucleotidyltransferase with HDIG domain
MQDLDAYLDRVKKLPPAPRILPELLGLLRQDNTDSERVVSLISLDPSITASVIRLCNSACFGGSMPVTDLQQAVTRLGFQQLYQLVAAICGSRLLSAGQTGYGLDAGELWKHSVTTAVAARLFAASRDEDASAAFTAGLLHDLGKIVLSEALEKKYAQLVEDAVQQQAALLESEQRLLGVQHAAIGGRLLARWNFPESLVHAVTFHHQPSAAPSHQRLAACVYLGNMVAYFMGHGYGRQAFALRGRAESLTLLDLDPDAVPEFMIKTFEQLEEVEALFSA